MGGIDGGIKPGGALDDALGNGVAGEAGHIMNVQFVHDLLTMFFDGLDADTEFGGDLFVGAAFGDELKDFSFAGSQIVGATFNRLSGDKGFAALVAEALGDGGTEEGVSLMGFANGFQEVVSGGLLNEVTSGASFCELLHVFVVTVRREDQDFGAGAGAGDLACSFEAVENGHGNVHDYDVGEKFFDQLNCLASVFGLADDIDVFFGGEESSESLSHDGVVIGQKYFNFVHKILVCSI